MENDDIIKGQDQAVILIHHKSIMENDDIIKGQDHADTLIRYYQRSHKILYTLAIFTVIFCLMQANNTHFNLKEINIDIRQLDLLLSYICLLDLNNFIDIGHYTNMQNLKSGVFSLTNVVLAFIGILIFTFVFQFVRNRGIHSFDEKMSIDVKSQSASINLSTINVIYTTFGLPLYLIMIVYLLGKGAYVELAFLTIVIIGYSSIQNTARIAINDNLFDYWALKSINEDYSDISASKLLKRGYKFVMGKFPSIMPIFIIPFSNKGIKIKVGEDFLQMIKFHYMSNLTRETQNCIYLLAIVWLPICVFLNFNLITIILFEFTLLLWYFQISLFKHIPNNKVTIVLNDPADTFSNVFIIEDFLNYDHITIKTEQCKAKETIRIMRSAIKRIYTVVT